MRSWLCRQRGYFGHGRDTFRLDGKVPPGINQGVPGASIGKLLLPAGLLRPVAARFNDETITVQEKLGSGCALRDTRLECVTY